MGVDVFDGNEWNHRINYMWNFKDVSPDIHSKYMELYNFMDRYDRSELHKNIEGDVIMKEADRLWDFQRFCKVAEDEEEVRRESERQFMLSDVTDALMVRMEMIHLYQELIDYNSTVGSLLFHLERDTYRTSDGVKEVQRYLRACDRDNWSWTPD